MSFITNNDIMYIKYNIRRSVFKLIKKACDIKKEVKECMCNTVYL